MSTARHVHFVGIGGIGMSAIAKVMLEDGWQVSGCDLRPSPLALRLAERGARIWAGHAPDHVDHADMVIVTAAVPPDNVEIAAARQRGIAIVRRADALGRLMDERIGIAVAGTHGKTTTTAMIAHILEQAGLDPTVLAGGEMLNLGGNAKRGAGLYLVAEADEFDGAFWSLRPGIAVITNIEAEHLDYYGTASAVIAAFARFAANVATDGHIVACGDDPGVSCLLKSGAFAATTTTYGLKDENAWRAADLRAEGGNYAFTAIHAGTEHGSPSRVFDRLNLAVPGRHNVFNALAAIAVADIVGVPSATIRDALASFRGVKRRFELRGSIGGITIIDDYGHHPTEIRATLATARERFGDRRLVCVFQPHTYSRTKHLLSDFATCFDDADVVIITDIYPAREHDTLGISSLDLVAALKHGDGRYGGSLEQTVSLLENVLQPGDVLLTVGAGDIDTVGGLILERLR